jgi:hypothetical protein
MAVLTGLLGVLGLSGLLMDCDFLEKKGTHETVCRAQWQGRSAAAVAAAVAVANKV